MTYDRSRLRALGRRREKALDELERVRQEVAAELSAARDTMTWREIGIDTRYTEQQLRTLALPGAEREAREEQRRRRRRRPRSGEK